MLVGVLSQWRESNNNTDGHYLSLTNVKDLSERKKFVSILLTLFQSIEFSEVL